MISLSLNDIAVNIGAELSGTTADIVIDEISTDSRDISQNCLFIALIGEKFDAHDFASVAVTNGAAALLVSKKLDLPVPQLLVKNTHLALGKLGALICRMSNPKSVAITGSNGKTSVKEMVATILSQHHSVLYTAGNFNNDIGVPLTALRLDKSYQYAVFELGANHQGEIDYTSDIVKPDVALVNNVSDAHLEGFGTAQGVANAKSEIFNHLNANGVAIINADDDYASLMQQTAQSYSQISFGVQSTADLQAVNLQVDPLGRYQYQVVWKQQTKQISLPLVGKHQVLNSLAAMAICLALDINIDEVIAGLEKMQPIAGRMCPTDLGSVHLIDDSYNANPASVKAAIDSLNQLSSKKILVLGDLGELGENAAQLHEELGIYAQKKGIDALYCIGELSANTSKGFGCQHFANITLLVSQLMEDLKRQTDVTILVKGSRSARMERVVASLTAAYERGELV